MKNVIIFALVSLSFLISAESKPLSLKQKKLQMKFKKPISDSLSKFEKECGCSLNYEMDWSNLMSFDDGLIGKKIIVNSSMHLISLCKEGLSKEICSAVKSVNGRKGAPSFKIKNKTIYISVPKDTGPYPNKNQFENNL